MRLSRRNFLLGGGMSVIGAVGFSGWFLWQIKDHEDVIVRLLMRIFGEDFASRAVYAEFAQKHAGRYLAADRMIKLAILLDRRAATRWLRPAFNMAVPANFEYRLQRFYSLLATEFLQNTTFLDRDPGEELAYQSQEPLGPYVCRNPLAQYDSDD